MLNRRMLSDSAKQTIRLEEVYRDEIRRSIALQERSLWDFLQSELGRWLLTAVFVTAGGWLVTRAVAERDRGRLQLQALIEASRRRDEAIGRLDLEIGYRFSQVQQRLAEISEEPDTPQRTRRVRNVIESFYTPSATNNFSPLYPEHRELSLIALVAELKRQAETPHLAKNPKDPNPEQLEQVLADLSGAKVFFNVRAAPFSAPTKVAAAIIDRVEGQPPLVLDRWKASKWYFLDGRAANPFP